MAQCCRSILITSTDYAAKFVFISIDSPELRGAVLNMTWNCSSSRDAFATFIRYLHGDEFHE